MDLRKIHGTSIKVPLRWAVAFTAVLLLAKGLWWLVRRFGRLLVLVLLVGLVVAGWHVVEVAGSGWVLAPACSLLVLGVGWRLVHPASFAPVVSWRARACWRRMWVYGREWRPLLRELGLAQKSGDEARFPQIVRVRSTDSVDRVVVRLLPGQTFADLAKHTDRMATCFDLVDCRARSVGAPDVARRLALWLSDRPKLPGWLASWATTRAGEPARLRRRLVELWCLTRDPLATPVSMLPIPDRPDLTRLPVAWSEDGLTWYLRLLATHLLIVGATGAGKGSVLWSIVRALGHGIRTRLVELWVIDPKGGMEFAAGQGLFTRFCHGTGTGEATTGPASTDNPDLPEDPGTYALDIGDTDRAGHNGKRTRRNSKPTPPAAHETAYAEILEEAVTMMQARQAALRGWSRLHVPTPGDPLIVIMIDEIASLTAYVVDRDVKRRIAAALNLLLSQGRAVGVLVIGAGQDARKETVDMRGLFPTRIALRTNEADDADMILGPGKRDKGARCDQIPTDLPGIAYVAYDGLPEPVRIRFAFIDDHQIDTLTKLYAPDTPDHTDTDIDDTDTTGPQVHGVPEHRLRLVDDSSKDNETTVNGIQEVA